MPTKHIDKIIEAYIDGRLLPKERRQVEAHIQECIECADRLFEAKRLNQQLGPTMQAALGQPALRPMLRQKVWRALLEKEARRPFYLNWTAPIRFLNALGSVAIIVLLAIGAFIVIQSQLPPVPNTTSLQTSSSSDEIVRITPTSTPFVLPEVGPTLQPTGSSLGDTLYLRTPAPLSLTADDVPAPIGIPSPSRPDDQITNNQNEAALLPELGPDEYLTHEQAAKVKLPGGTIAFALLNPPPGPQHYKIHFISPDGTNHRKFPLGGVSEPALHPTQTEKPLAFRAWNEPTSPRSIQSSDMEANLPQSITYFWEDAQPDWSPTENRIIFASQRENDRYWRLYTVWGDGSLEVNLRREGRSPTFAPDGYRFAFESCDSAGNPCGLWVGDLENSEHDSKPILEDPLAKSPDWSPVTEDIAYMANPDGDWDLYLVKSDGSNIRRLTNSPANDGLPTWSPDGKWLAFVSDRGGQWGIWLLQVGTGRLHQTITFAEDTWIPPDRAPYNEQEKRQWWDEQLSWGPEIGD